MHPLGLRANRFAAPLEKAAENNSEDFAGLPHFVE
jgi:hypothetical protein